MASVLARQCSNQFGCEDPYTRSRPICWVHLNPCIEWNMKMMWTAEIQILKWRYDWRSGNFNFSNILQIAITTVMTISSFKICISAVVFFSVHNQHNVYNKIITINIYCSGTVSRWYCTFFIFNLYTDFHIFPFVNFRENIIERR